MENVEVIKKFTHKGFYCEVRKIPPAYGTRRILASVLPDCIANGHYCGYVFLDKDHPLYGVKYDYINDTIEPCVNGGLTYSDFEGEQWVLGFDFCHCWNEDGGTVEEAIKDCKALCKQLKKVKSFEVDMTDDFYSDKLPDAVIIKEQRYEPIKPMDTPITHEEIKKAFDILSDNNFIDELKDLCAKYQVVPIFNEVNAYAIENKTDMNVTFCSEYGVINPLKVWR